MEAAQDLLRSMNRTLSEDECSVDQSSRDNNSPSDSAFHSDFSFISIQDLGNSLSGNKLISFPYSSKTPIGWTDDRSSRPLTTATFRLLAFRQKPTFYSVREQTRKCRTRDLLSNNNALEDDEYSLLANDGLSSDSDVLAVAKTRQAAAIEADEAEVGARDAGKSPSRDSCEGLTLFGDDEDSVASEVLWSPSSHNPAPSRPDFVPQLDLSWTAEDEKSAAKQRSKKAKAIQCKPKESLGNSVQCKIDVNSQPPAINARDIEKCNVGSLGTRGSNYWREVNCGIQTKIVTSLNDNNHHHHHPCSEDGAVEKELLHCPGDRSFVEESAVHRNQNKSSVSGASSKHSTSSESLLRERALNAFRTRSLEVQAVDRASQNQCPESSTVSAFPSDNIQKSSSLSAIELTQQQQFLSYDRRNCRSKPAILYYADETQRQTESAASCTSRTSHATTTGRRTSPEHSGTDPNSPYETSTGPRFCSGNRLYDVEAAVERYHNKARQLSFCNLAFYCLCCRTNCYCNYSCCRWGCTGEDR